MSEKSISEMVGEVHGGAAFPRAAFACHHPDGYPRHEDWGDVGMSLRDYFAGQAATALLMTTYSYKRPDSDVAKYCYDFADAMLAAREKKV